MGSQGKNGFLRGLRGREVDHLTGGGLCPHLAVCRNSSGRVVTLTIVPTNNYNKQNKLYKTNGPIGGFAGVERFCSARLVFFGLLANPTGRNVETVFWYCMPVIPTKFGGRGALFSGRR